MRWGVSGKRLSVAPIGQMRENLLAQRQERRGVLQLTLQPVCQQRKARSDIADHLGMRRKDLLHRRRHIADMDHFWPTRTHQKGRLLDRVMADGENQVGLVDGLVHVVSLGERRRSHVKVRPAGHRALAHLGIEKRNTHATDEI